MSILLSKYQSSSVLNEVGIKLIFGKGRNFDPKIFGSKSNLGRRIWALMHQGFALDLTIFVSSVYLSSFDNLIYFDKIRVLRC